MFGIECLAHYDVRAHVALSVGRAMGRAVRAEPARFPQRGASCLQTRVRPQLVVAPILDCHEAIISATAALSNF
jgi:hypothetical protein